MLRFIYLCVLFLIVKTCPQMHAQGSQKESLIAYIDFDNLPSGAFSNLDLGRIILKSESGEDRILGKGGRILSQCLYITGGKDHLLEFSLKDNETPIQHISFKGQKLSSDKPFEFILEAFTNDEWHEIYSESSLFTTERFSDVVYISVPGTLRQRFPIRPGSVLLPPGQNLPSGNHTSVH